MVVSDITLTFGGFNLLIIYRESRPLPSGQYSAIHITLMSNTPGIISVMYMVRPRWFSTMLWLLFVSRIYSVMKVNVFTR